MSKTSKHSKKCGTSGTKLRKTQNGFVAIARSFHTRKSLWHSRSDPKNAYICATTYVYLGKLVPTHVPNRCGTCGTRPIKHQLKSNKWPFQNVAQKTDFRVKILYLTLDINQYEILLSNRPKTAFDLVCVTFSDNQKHPKSAFDLGIHCFVPDLCHTLQKPEKDVAQNSDNSKSASDLLFHMPATTAVIKVVPQKHWFSTFTYIYAFT